MKFIKKYKTALIIAFVCILLMVLAFFAVYRMFYPSNDKSVYGNRLDNAPIISDEVISKIKEDLLKTELIESFEYKTSVKTMKFYIDVKSTTKVDKAKNLSETIIANLTDDITNFYDISIYLTQKNGENVEYPAIGYHAKGEKTFNWVVNKEVSDIEE